MSVQDPKNYLHGYTFDEQDRLYRQSRVMEPVIFKNITFSDPSHIIEVGCGVGAQTKILKERFPNLKIEGVDISEAQINRAKEYLKDEIDSGDVHLTLSTAEKLPFEKDSFNGGFSTFVLEHVEDPVSILRDVRRVLKPNSPMYLNEVLNSSFYVHPYSPSTLQFWFAMNDHQWNLKGDPFVGAKLANYLYKAGFKNISTKTNVHHYDNRHERERSIFIEYWIELLLSAAPSMISAGVVEEKTVEDMTKELKLLKSHPESVFYYAWIQALAFS